MAGSDVRNGSDGHTTTRPRAASWSPSGVIKAILQRELDGAPLNSAAVAKQYAGLYHAAIRRFCGWNGALQAAGIDPAEVRQRIPWSRQSIVRRIRQLARAGSALNSAAIKQSESDVMGAAIRHYGSWSKALVAAGLDPDLCRIQLPPWTRERLTKAIGDIHSEGGRLNPGASEIASMKDAAERLFGSWEAALQSAGLDPDKIRRHRKPWTARAVLDEIRRRHCAGKALNCRHVLRSSLWSGAVRHFGSWDAALTAGGLDPGQIRRYKPRCMPWTSETILREIKKRHEGGEPLNAGHVLPVSLYQWGCKLFGSWDAALTAAGLDPRRCRRSQLPWTRERIIEAIKDIHSRGGRLNHKAGTYRTMKARASRLFGSWDAALQAAGLDPAKIRLHRKKWTAETVVAEIRLKHRKGEALNCTSVSHSSLHVGATRCFGAWDSALMAAGLDPANIRKSKPACRPWTPDTVLREILRRRQAGEPLNYSAVFPVSLRLRGAKFFGSWDKALAATGLDPLKIRKHRPSRRRRTARRRAEYGR
jgi:hypothetical protein